MNTDVELDGGHRLMPGDCLERMLEITDGSVDMVLCDLPYGTTACKWDSVIPFAPLWAHYRRVCKRNAAIVLTASQPFTSLLVASNVAAFRHAWVWDKAMAANVMNARHQPLKIHEDVIVFSFDGAAKYYPQMTVGRMRKKGGHRAKTGIYGEQAATEGVMSDQYHPKSILPVSNANQSGRVHPTQKPVALMEYLIRTYTNEGETVLDNTMGSGTTGVACVNTGRRFIGIEQDEAYFGIAYKRIVDRISELKATAV